MGYSNQKSLAVVAPATAVVTKGTNVIGSYDFKVVKLMAGWQTAKNDASPVTFDTRVWTLGATIPVFGKDEVLIGYDSLKNKLASGADSKLLAVRYLHPLSKRTTLYGTWAQMSNDGAAARTLGGAPAVGALGYDPSAVQVGINHKF